MGEQSEFHRGGCLPQVSFLETEDIGTTQAQTSVRLSDRPTTSRFDCLLSATFRHRPISTGKKRDTESGNDYFGARYYASTMGRFLSPDPIIQNELRLVNPQRWNKYAYVINNPLTLTDPTGKDAVFVDFSKK